MTPARFHAPFGYRVALIGRRGVPKDGGQRNVDATWQRFEW